MAPTLCGCPADVNETISGTLLGAGDGGFALVAQTDQPIYQDLNSPEERAKLALGTKAVLPFAGEVTKVPLMRLPVASVWVAPLETVGVVPLKPKVVLPLAPTNE